MHSNYLYIERIYGYERSESEEHKLTEQSSQEFILL